MNIRTHTKRSFYMGVGTLSAGSSSDATKHGSAEERFAASEAKIPVPLRQLRNDMLNLLIQGVKPESIERMLADAKTRHVLHVANSRRE